MPLYQRLFNPGISSDLVNVALNNERQVDGGRIVRNKTFMSATVGKKKNKGMIHSARQVWYCSFVRPTIYKRTGHLERYSSIALECLARPSSDARTRLLVGCHVITIGGRHLSTFECQAPKADIGYKVWKSYIKHHNPPSFPLTAHSRHPRCSKDG